MIQVLYIWRRFFGDSDCAATDKLGRRRISLPLDSEAVVARSHRLGNINAPPLFNLDAGRTYMFGKTSL